MCRCRSQGDERQVYDSLLNALNASRVQPTMFGFVNSASGEYLDLNKYYEALDQIGSFDQFRDSNVKCLSTNVVDDAPADCARRFEIWVASERGRSRDKL